MKTILIALALVVVVIGAGLLTLLFNAAGTFSKAQGNSNYIAEAEGPLQSSSENRRGLHLSAPAENGPMILLRHRLSRFCILHLRHGLRV
jgi:hypothetical protein